MSSEFVTVRDKLSRIRWVLASRKEISEQDRQELLNLANEISNVIG